MNTSAKYSRRILLGVLLCICFASWNASAVAPRVPYLYDPITGTMKATPVPMKPAGMDTAPLAAQAVVGTRQCIVILLQFSDHAANTAAHPSSAYSDLLFSTGVVPSGSMKEFYEEVSYNQFTVAGQVTPWLTAPQTYAYYVNSNYGWGAWPQNAQQMAYDACAVADPTVDFSQYDNDGPDGIPNSGDDDGIVDGLFVVHSGPGAEDTGSSLDIWSHKWTIRGPYGYYYQTSDAAYGGGYIYCRSYSTEPEQFGDGSMQTIGVFAHEFGHILGMPDLYDYNSGYINVWDGNNYPLAYWCLMSLGSWSGPGNDGSVPSHPSAYIKMLLGWLSPTVLSASQSGIPIQEVETTNGAQSLYQVVLNDFGGAKEYFLIENRDPNSTAWFDKYESNNYSPAVQMDGGVLIYHIDERWAENDDGPSLPHYTVWIEDPGMTPLSTNPTQRTSAPEYELKGNAAYALEDGQIDFNLNTGYPYHYLYPNSNTNDGASSGVAVHIATNSGPTMIFDLGVGSAAQVSAPPALPCDPGQSVDFVFTVRNPGGYNETYDLLAASSHGFPLACPSTVGAVGPFGATQVTVTLTVPSSHQEQTIDYITLRATSQMNPSVWDEATTEAPVATAIADFVALAKRGGVDIHAEFSSALNAQRVNVYRGDGDAEPIRVQSIDGVSGSAFDYFDSDVAAGAGYRYQIGVVEPSGEVRSPSVEVHVPLMEASLGHNYPNPFNPTTSIPFTLPAAQRASLDVYAVDGRRIKRLFDGMGSAGENMVTWDGTDSRGHAVGSGVYYYRLSSARFNQTRTMVLLR